jgi:alpha-L-fucosidase
MSMCDYWSFKPFDDYKSTQELLHILVDIVCKGGNFLLSVPVISDGRITPPAVEHLKQMGAWLQINGEAIYGTRMFSRYRDGNICYTMKGKYVYAIYLDEKQEAGENHGLPEKVHLIHVGPVDGIKVVLVGVEEPLQWKTVVDGIIITVPPTVTQSPSCQHAYSFRF